MKKIQEEFPNLTYGYLNPGMDLIQERMKRNSVPLWISLIVGSHLKCNFE
jgi:hypothetical protein